VGRGTCGSTYSRWGCGPVQLIEPFQALWANCTSTLGDSSCHLTDPHAPPPPFSSCGSRSWIAKTRNRNPVPLRNRDGDNLSLNSEREAARWELSAVGHPARLRSGLQTGVWLLTRWSKTCSGNRTKFSSRYSLLLNSPRKREKKLFYQHHGDRRSGRTFWHDPFQSPPRRKSPSSPPRNIGNHPVAGHHLHLFCTSGGGGGEAT
jgi:hypothetical protein